MQIITRHYYTDWTEVQQHDLVSLKGFDSNREADFDGICKIGSFDGHLLSAYFLGQKHEDSYDIEIYLEDIEKLVKVDNKKIDEAFTEALELLG